VRSDERPRAWSGALWIGLLAGPLAWSAQELVGYGLAARACGAGGPRPIAIAPALGVAELVVSGAALLITVLGLVTALLAWRRSNRDRAEAGEPPLEAIEGRTRFMAVAGILVSTLFLFGILMNAAGYFLVRPCA
jgi:hypothetical protein